MSDFEKHVYTTSQILAEIQGSVERQYSHISMIGEVTNLSKSPVGHVYFNMSDETGLISCAFFRGFVASSGFQLSDVKDGDNIIVFGDVSVYSKRGTIQFIVKRIEISNREGLLKKQIAQTKKKLQLEGLFDLDRKQSIPINPQKVALITSPKSAAAADFLSIVHRRSLSSYIVIIPTVMQGDQGAKSIINSIKMAQGYQEFDLIVIARGGGSFEDLYCFNDERLLRCVSNCPIPIISAVGHEVDYTLLDYISDFRSETPSACAEKITQYQFSIKDKISSLRASLIFLIKNHIMNIGTVLHKHNPVKAINSLQVRVEAMSKRLQGVSFPYLLEKVLNIKGKSQDMDFLLFRMQKGYERKIQTLKSRLQEATLSVEAASPRSILSKGYSYIESHEQLFPTKEKFLTSKPSLFTIHFHDGDVRIKRYQVESPRGK